ncbi:internalin [Leptospira interrogans]|uniref:internalin n=1 Tax=Leptospira interrogans TaxID=173 RepID=UPI0010C02916|nr:internalin [Leptospira interrogans]QCO42524.1 internalin [Leptospira interrogans]ULG91671.1 internalin [Leptospira interrogans]
MSHGKSLTYYWEKEYQNDDTFLYLIEDDITGGKILKERIDTIKSNPQANTIQISGLRQDTFNYFVENYASQFEAIYFWKCPLVEDLSALSKLENIQYILFYWNQRAVRLWDMSKNSSLKGIAIDDFSRMHNLTDFVSSKTIEEIHFGNLVWTKFTVESLSPLVYCKKLKFLDFNLKKLKDNDISYLEKITELKSLHFDPNLFTTEQIAWLRAARPDIESSSLEPFRKLKNPIVDNREKTLDVIVNGKGKPSLNSDIDKVKLEKYISTFNALVEKYRGKKRSF